MTTQKRNQKLWLHTIAIEPWAQVSFVLVYFSNHSTMQIM